MKDEIKISEILEGKLDYIKRYINAAKRNNVSLNGGYQAISFHHWEELLDYIINLQEENNKLKNLEYKFFDCSGDEESFTLEDYLQLGNKLYDLQEENQKLNNKIKRLNSKIKLLEHNCKQAEDSCRQHRLANKNKKRRLQRREEQINLYKTRNEKAIEYIKSNLDNTGWLEIGSQDVDVLLNILQGKSDE